MAKNDNDGIFSGEYSQNQTSTDNLTASTADATSTNFDKIDSEIYGTKKPKRIIFKANLINEDS